MDRISEAIKKIDELIAEATREPRLKKNRMTAVRALTAVRRVLTRSRTDLPLAKTKARAENLSRLLRSAADDASNIAKLAVVQQTGDRK